MTTDSPAFWHWPALLGLDIPLVACLWTALLAKTFAVELVLAQYALLFFGTWLWISAGRLFCDSKQATTTLPTFRRQFFCRRHKLFTVAWCAVLLFCVVLAIRHFHQHEWTAALVLIFAAALILLSHNIERRGKGFLLPCELSGALLLSIAVYLFIIPRLNVAANLLLWPFLTLAVLFTLTFWIISAFDFRAKRLAGHSSLAHQFPFMNRKIGGVVWLLALASLLLSFFHPFSYLEPFFLAVAASCFNLYLLEWFAPMFHAESARSIAPAMLLTPLIPLLVAF